jgi:hypothetical protein
MTNERLMRPWIVKVFPWLGDGVDDSSIVPEWVAIEAATAEDAEQGVVFLFRSPRWVQRNLPIAAESPAYRLEVTAWDGLTSSLPPIPLPPPRRVHFRGVRKLAKRRVRRR